MTSLGSLRGSWGLGGVDDDGDDEGVVWTMMDVYGV